MNSCNSKSINLTNTFIFQDKSTKLNNKQAVWTLTVSNTDNLTKIYKKIMNARRMVDSLCQFSYFKKINYIEIGKYYIDILISSINQYEPSSELDYILLNKPAVKCPVYIFNCYLNKNNETYFYGCIEMSTPDIDINLLKENIKRFGGEYG